MGITVTHALCGHPILAGRCFVCRNAQVAKRYREEANILQMLTADYSEDTPAQMAVRSALTSATRALREDARTCDDIAADLLTKYGVQSTHAAD